MLIENLKEATWYQISLMVVLSVLVPLVIQVLVKILLVFRNRNRQLKALEKFDGPLGHWLLGNVKEFGVDVMLDNLVKWKKVYRDPYRLHMALDKFTLQVTTPDNIKAILSTAEPKSPGTYGFFTPWLGEGLLVSAGSKWFRNRKLLTPGFHFDILKPYVGIFGKSAQIMMDKWKKNKDINKGVRLEMFEHVSLMTLDNMLKCAFGHEGDCQQSKSPYIQSVYDASALCVKRIRNFPHHSDFIYSMSEDGKKFYKAVKIAQDYSSNIIKSRKESKEKEATQSPRNSKYLDFLDILLQARDEDGQGMTEKEIQAEVDTFLFEGHDTTASGISWCLYNLARHPEHQDKCREEIREVIADKDEIEWNDLSKLTYLTMCIKESMRIHPPVPSVGRKTTKPLTLADGRVIPPGTSIRVGIYEVHHDADFWKDPDVYDPLRFSSGNSEGRHPFSFVQFSAGPRNCIGQHFAMAELRTCLAMILHQFQFTWKEDTPPMKLPEMILRSKHGIWLNVERLDN